MHSPETLAGNIDEGMLFDISPTALSTPESEISLDLLSQLRSAAGCESPNPYTPSSENSADDNAALATEKFLNICDESDRTDFRESPSPSVRKPKNVARRTTG